MAEESGQVAAGTAVAEPLLASVPDPSTPAMNFSTAIDAEGNFKEGWLNLLDEDIRGESYLKEAKNVPAVMRSLVHARRMVGKDMVSVPNENSTEAEREEFYTAIGKPSTPEDYNIKRPNDFPEAHWSPELATAAQQMFHKLGLTEKQVAGIVEFNNANTLQTLQSQEQSSQLVHDERVAGLQKEWGDAFEQKKHLGNVAIEQGTGGDGEFKDRIVEKYGSDPDFVKFAANLGGKFAEHGTVVPEMMIPTPSDMDIQIKELMAKDAYLNADNPQHKQLVEQVQALFRKKTGEARTL